MHLKLLKWLKILELSLQNFINPENVDDLCRKTIEYGQTWAKRAEPLWEENLRCKKGCVGCSKKEEKDYMKV